MAGMQCTDTESVGTGRMNFAGRKVPVYQGVMVVQAEGESSMLPQMHMETLAIVLYM